jgi:hypothetical protein
MNEPASKPTRITPKIIAEEYELFTKHWDTKYGAYYNDDKSSWALWNKLVDRMFVVPTDAALDQE